EFKGSDKGVSQDVAIRRVITSDNWLSTSITKVRPPKSASESIRAEMIGILQTIEGASSARYKWGKLYLEALEKTLEVDPMAGSVQVRIGAEAAAFLN